MAGGTCPDRQHRDQGREDQHRAGRLGSPGHRLASYRLGGVDEQHVAVPVQLLQRRPPAVQEEGVALRELRRLLADVSTESLDRQDDDVVLASHPRVDPLPHEAGPWWHHHLGDPGVAGDQLGDLGAEGVVSLHHLGVLAEVGRHVVGHPHRQQPAAQQRTDRHGSDE